MAMISVRFVGGPLDEEVRAVPDLLAEWRVAECATDWQHWSSDQGAEPLRVNAICYRLFTIDAYPTLDEEGNYLYRFAGRHAT